MLLSCHLECRFVSSNKQIFWRTSAPCASWKMALKRFNNTVRISCDIVRTYPELQPSSEVVHSRVSCVQLEEMAEIDYTSSVRTLDNLGMLSQVGSWNSRRRIRDHLFLFNFFKYQSYRPNVAMLRHITRTSYGKKNVSIHFSISKLICKHFLKYGCFNWVA